MIKTYFDLQVGCYGLANKRKMKETNGNRNKIGHKLNYGTEWKEIKLIEMEWISKMVRSGMKGNGKEKQSKESKK